MEKTCFSNIIVFAICIINTTLCANALDFKYDGINYTAITDNTCMTKEGTYDNTTGNHTAGSWVRDDLIIPKIVYDSNGKSYAVTSIGKWSFAGCSRLSTVTILSEVASIEDGAFSQCTHVSSVTLPNSVTSIGALAFNKCSHLDSINLPQSLVKIDNYAFSDCSNLTTINIPESVTTINTDAFSGCQSLEQVNISNLETWCNIKFGNHSSNPLSYAKHLNINGERISNLKIPNSVTTIKQNTFIGWQDITSVTIPNSVSLIDDWAFCACTNLTSIDIPNSVVMIGETTFSGCSSLTSIYVPNSVSSIGSYAFYGCTEVKSIIFEDGSKNLNIGYSAIGVPHTTYAYFGRQMDFTAMTYANLETVEFGDNVSSIKSCAFLKGNNIRTVISHRNIPPSTDDTFNSETYCNGILYVPEASVEKYANANGWKQFLNIKPLEGYDGVVEIPSHKNNLVVVSGSEIRVSSDKRVRILSINGTVFYNSIGDCCISVAPGIYIVIVGDTTTKVAVK
jgi:hypothetical protein